MNARTNTSPSDSPSDFSGFELRVPENFGNREERLVDFAMEKPNSYERLYGRHAKQAVDWVVEKYPHIVDSIIRRWGNPGELDTYLRSLVINDRGANRQGFEHGLLEELSLLKAIHDEAYGKARPTINPMHREIPGADQWDGSFLR